MPSGNGRARRCEFKLQLGGDPHSAVQQLQSDVRGIHSGLQASIRLLNGPLAVGRATGVATGHEQQGQGREHWGVTGMDHMARLHRQEELCIGSPGIKHHAGTTPNALRTASQSAWLLAAGCLCAIHDATRNVGAAVRRRKTLWIDVVLHQGWSNQITMGSRRCHVVG